MENCFHQNGVNGCRALASLLTSGRPFEELDFDRNGLSGIDDVAAALATNPQLETLYITDNKLNDRDAELIAQALKQNTNLHKLYLDENNITAAGFERIQTVIYDPSSLNAMEACNHTCWIDCMEGNDDYEGGNPWLDATTASTSQIVQVVVSATRGRQQRAPPERRAG